MILPFFDICIGDKSAHDVETAAYTASQETLRKYSASYSLPDKLEDLTEAQQEILQGLSPVRNT